MFVVILQTSPHTVDSSCLQKGEDYIHAFMLGFDIADAVALLRLDDLYIGGCFRIDSHAETFEIKDVRLDAQHLGRGGRDHVVEQLHVVEREHAQQVAREERDLQSDHGLTSQQGV